MSQNMGVVVLGLDELVARMRQVGAGWAPTEVRKIIRTQAQIIIDETIPVMRSQFVSPASKMDGQLEVSMRTSVSASKSLSAKIVEGRGGGEESSSQYAGVWEFGGYPGNRPYVSEGRALFPTVKKNRDKLVAAIEVAMKQMADLIEGS